MRFKRRRFPYLNEIVLCTVKKITPYAAFCELNGFEDKEGMLHIAEVSSRIIKNIKEYLSEGQKVICKVIRVNPSKGFIDLSIKRVAEFEKRRKRDEIKKERKAHKIIELFCEKKGLDADEFFEKYFRDLYEEGYIYELFERAVEDGKKILKKHLPEKFLEDFFAIIEKEFGKPFKEIRLIFNVVSYESDGVLRLRNFFSNLKEKLGKISDEIKLIYQGSPKYLAVLKTKDPKKTEKKLESTINELEKFAKSLNLEFSYEREKKWRK